LNLIQVKSPNLQQLKNFVGIYQGGKELNNITHKVVLHEEKLYFVGCKIIDPDTPLTPILDNLFMIGPVILEFKGNQLFISIDDDKDYIFTKL